jgi:diguanylate cyclase (GGDEF)-like protein/PAS domain S-box-containing protein
MANIGLPAPAQDAAAAPASDRLPAPASDRLPAPASDRLPAPASDRLPAPASDRLPAPAQDVAAAHERARVSTLHRFGVLDTPAEQAFDELTALAAQLCGTPMALVTLVDAERQWFKSRLGVAVCETSREVSFCVHALAGQDILVVPDTRADPRFAGNPLVSGESGIRFYAGAPLITAAGHALGTLCVLDTVARNLTARQLDQLGVLARQVVSQLELRRQGVALAEEVAARTSAQAVLRDNQRLLDGVLEHTDVLIYAKDLHGRFVLANAALHQFLGDRARVLRTDVPELIPARAAEQFRRHDSQIASGGHREVFAEQLMHQDGTAHEFLSTKFPLRDEHGRVYAVAGVSTDVTELSEERRAHADAEQRWRALVEYSPVAVAVIGSDAHFAYANPQAVALYGAQHPNEVIGRLAAEFVPEGDEQATAALFGTLVAGGPPLLGHRWTLRRLDGRLVAVEINAAAVTHLGEPAVQVELRDMTVQAAAEAALRESARRFRALFACSPVGTAESLPDGTMVAVNPQRAAHDELAARRAFTDAVLDSIDVGIVACDADGHLTVFNDATKAWHGIDLTARPTDAADPDRFAATFDLHDAEGRPLPNDQIPLLRALTEGSVRDAEIVISPRELPATRVLCSGRALTAPDGRPLGAVVAMTDITASRAQTRALQASEQRFRTTFANDPAGLAVLSPEGHPLQVNAALCRLLGRGEAELLGAPDLWALAGIARAELAPVSWPALHGSGATLSSELRLVRADGHEVWALLTVVELPDPREGTCVLAQVEDVTARRSAEQRLTRQALHDSLTDLPNRTMLLDRTAAALGNLTGCGMVALLFCDLDGFKAVNDTHGHDAGDHLLIEVARRLAQVVRPIDTVARLGGDEFVVLCEELRDHDEVTQIAVRLQEAVAAPIAYRGVTLTVTASVGIAHGAGALTAEELVARADAAMYQAKRLGKHRHAVFDDVLPAPRSGAPADRRRRV